MTTQCAWCSPTLDPNVSHGVCARCAGEVEARTWTPRWEREIDDILSAQNLGTSAANAQDWADFEHLTPEETAAKADATRASWGVGVTAARARRGEVLGSSPDLPFSPTPPAPYVPRNRVDPVRVACYVACALLLGVVWGQVLRWAL